MPLLYRDGVDQRTFSSSLPPYAFWQGLVCRTTPCADIARMRDSVIPQGQGGCIYLERQDCDRFVLLYIPESCLRRGKDPYLTGQVRHTTAGSEIVCKRIQCRPRYWLLYLPIALLVLWSAGLNYFILALAILFPLVYFVDIVQQAVSRPLYRLIADAAGIDLQSLRDDEITGR